MGEQPDLKAVYRREHDLGRGGYIEGKNGNRKKRTKDIQKY